MFTTIETVKELTGYEVTQETIIMAQNIVESYVGRDEVEVTNAHDRDLLGKATAYQSAYMHGDQERTFSQMKVGQMMESGNMVTFTDDGASPWIAPLAIIACRRLSWRRIRSVKTGSIFSEPVTRPDWRTA